MAVKLTFTGGKEIEARLRELGGAVAGRLGVNATKAGARVIAAAARQRVPVVTGRLKKGITVVGDDDLRRQGGSTRAAYATVKGVRYAHLVELGTAHSAAKPFLRPALDESGQEAVDRMGANLWGGIERELSKVRK
jgi:HK97 gp10 family phage protein